MPKIYGKDVPTLDGVWIIHTFRPSYRLLNPSRDPETAEAMAIVEKGYQSAMDSQLSKAYASKNPQLLVESLPYSEKRIKNQIWIEADKNGNIVIQDNGEYCPKGQGGKLARKVWDQMSNDPDPKPELDPFSAPLPDVEILPEGEKKTKIQI